MISVLQLGTISYAEGLRLQQKMVELRKAGQIGDLLLLLEHTPVITLGRNAKAANVLVSAEALAARGVEVFECDRGGDVTFHGPGQIVGYPIFDLRGFERSSQSSVLSSQEEQEPVAAPRVTRKTLGAVDYVRLLEEVIIRTCADFGIATKRVAGLTGVWTEAANGGDESKGGGAQSSLDCARDFASGLPLRSRPRCGSTSTSRDDSRSESFNFARDDNAKTKIRAEGWNSEAKIAAIGVHISRGVTSHGFALNVNTDLSYFNLIVPCGITAKPVTSMQKELGREPDVNEVAKSISRNFGVVFGRQILWVDTIDALLGHIVGVPMKPPAELRKLHGGDEPARA